MSVVLLFFMDFYLKGSMVCFCTENHRLTFPIVSSS
jgi:hypothetical protein